jgi:D-alanine--poly(phosphoribitol) ligase subunit 1
VAAVGDRTAIAFTPEHVLTYAELDALSNRAARYLRDRGLGRGDRIAFQFDKCPTAYVLMLGAVKAGVAYVALDPRSPARRTEAILDQCRPRLYFAERGREPLGTAELVACDPTGESPAFCAGYETDPLPDLDRIDGSTPAYVMFTSGSTGTPKGAVMSQDNLLHFVSWCRTAYGFTPEDVHTNLNPLHFDNSVFDVYSTLFSGGTLVPFDLATTQNPMALTARLRQFGCTTWFSVPSLLMFLQLTQTATRENLGGLRRIIFGGEGYPKTKLEHLFDVVGAETELHNVYGPTECTCICSTYRITAADFEDLEGFPPLGRLTPNFSYVLLDEDDREPAPGAPGELCLGGPCVGLGYFARPDLSGRAFVQNPLQPAHREILYRTGDLVRRDPVDGKLYFVGRRDLQVKHMGYRVELEEVQHAVGTFEGIDEVVVLHQRSGDVSELVAVIATSQDLDVKAIRRHAAERLPPYMRPSRVHVIPEMPKNANGKTDRRALADSYGERARGAATS